MSDSQSPAAWLSEAPYPRRIIGVDDTLTADAAYRLASEGTALLWQGDFQNARQLLQALARRLDRRSAKVSAGNTAAEDFHRYRMGQAQRARLLGALLIPLHDNFSIPLRRAPDVREACAHTFSAPVVGEAMLPLRELLGIIGAHEWRRKGVPVPALGASIFPHYGVFAPVRGEYVDLVARAPLPANACLAWDIGTGSGVLAALLVKRGIARVIATDASERALACAADNLHRLGLATPTTLLNTHGATLFPADAPCADLIVCNPPWLPGKAGSLLEQAVYDPDSAMLRGFLAGLSAHLAPQGEGWLILSDLAERLGLRSRETLTTWIDNAGLRVIDRLDTRPSHRKTRDATDPLHAARAGEVTSLWRLARANPPGSPVGGLPCCGD